MLDAAQWAKLAGMTHINLIIPTNANTPPEGESLDGVMFLQKESTNPWVIVACKTLNTATLQAFISCSPRNIFKTWNTLVSPSGVSVMLAQPMSPTKVVTWTLPLVAHVQ